MPDGKTIVILLAISAAVYGGNKAVHVVDHGVKKASHAIHCVFGCKSKTAAKMHTDRK